MLGIKKKPEVEPKRQEQALPGQILTATMEQHGQGQTHQQQLGQMSEQSTTPVAVAGRRSLRQTSSPGRWSHLWGSPSKKTSDAVESNGRQDSSISPQRKCTSRSPLTHSPSPAEASQAAAARSHPVLAQAVEPGTVAPARGNRLATGAARQKQHERSYQPLGGSPGVAAMDKKGAGRQKLKPGSRGIGSSEGETSTPGSGGSHTATGVDLFRNVFGPQQQQMQAVGLMGSGTGIFAMSMAEAGAVQLSLLPTNAELSTGVVQGAGAPMHAAALKQLQEHGAAAARNQQRWQALVPRQTAAGSVLGAQAESGEAASSALPLTKVFLQELLCVVSDQEAVLAAKKDVLLRQQQQQWPPVLPRLKVPRQGGIEIATRGEGVCREQLVGEVGVAGTDGVDFRGQAAAILEELREVLLEEQPVAESTCKERPTRKSDKNLMYVLQPLCKGCGMFPFPGSRDASKEQEAGEDKVGSQQLSKLGEQHTVELNSAAAAAAAAATVGQAVSTQADVNIWPATRSSHRARKSKTAAAGAEGREGGGPAATAAAAAVQAAAAAATTVARSSSRVSAPVSAVSGVEGAVMALNSSCCYMDSGTGVGGPAEVPAAAATQEGVAAAAAATRSSYQVTAPLLAVEADARRATVASMSAPAAADAGVGAGATALNSGTGASGAGAVPTAATAQEGINAVAAAVVAQPLVAGTRAVDAKKADAIGFVEMVCCPGEGGRLTAIERLHAQGYSWAPIPGQFLDAHAPDAHCCKGCFEVRSKIESGLGGGRGRGSSGPGGRERELVGEPLNYGPATRGRIGGCAGDSDQPVGALTSSHGAPEKHSSGALVNTSLASSKEGMGAAGAGRYPKQAEQQDARKGREHGSSSGLHVASQVSGPPSRSMHHMVQVPVKAAIRPLSTKQNFIFDCTAVRLCTPCSLSNVFCPG